MSKGIATTSALFVGVLTTSAAAAEPAAEGEASAGISLGDDGVRAEGDADASTDADAGTDADADTEADADTNVDASTDDEPDRSRPSDRADRPWIRRWAPERMMGEAGLYGGVLVPSRRLELFEPDTALPQQGFKTFGRVAPDVGLRLGFYPFRFFGVEGEAGVMPTRTEDDLAATLWAMRLSFVGQLGLWSVTPFVLAGGGMLNVASDRAAAGSDIDASLHFGGGVKVFLTRYTQLRLDIRDNITAGQGVDDGIIHNPEVLLGFSVTLGRKREMPKDTDGDGIYDHEDACVTVPGVPEYDGCPIPDTDGDGILDPDDACVTEPGVPEYDGCPIPDTDGDGILDPDDACVDVPGVPEFQGCPDTDGDGIPDPNDQCVEEPEAKNGYQDTDGCPDELPKEIEKFSGVIEGIYFDTNKDTIKSKSEKILKEALGVLQKFPELRVQISGHTDSRGKRELNLDLSQRRAESVKRWMVEHGIDESRMTTRGVGPDEPIDTNRTKDGRAKNRRIEFKLITG